MVPVKLIHKKIKISELRSIINAVFDKIENQFEVEEILLEEDYYLYVSNEQKYKISNDFGEYFIGSLYDDWDFLSSILGADDLATPLNFMHIAPILDYLATEFDWYS